MLQHVGLQQLHVLVPGLAELLEGLLKPGDGLLRPAQRVLREGEGVQQGKVRAEHQRLVRDGARILDPSGTEQSVGEMIGGLESDVLLACFNGVHEQGALAGLVKGAGAHGLELGVDGHDGYRGSTGKFWAGFRVGKVAVRPHGIIRSLSVPALSPPERG